MYSRSLGAVVFIFVSLLCSLPASVKAQTQLARCSRVTADGLVTDRPITNSLTSDRAGCLIDSVRVMPSVYPEMRENHEFELFNNSYRDILFLHLIPLNAPEEELIFGGRRKLAPGRAWSVNLNNGCDYSVLVEYEDGVQDFYEVVNTCDYRGLQVR